MSSYDFSWFLHFCVLMHLLHSVKFPTISSLRVDVSFWRVELHQPQNWRPSTLMFDPTGTSNSRAKPGVGMGTLTIYLPCAFLQQVDSGTTVVPRHPQEMDPCASQIQNAQVPYIKCYSTVSHPHPHMWNLGTQSADCMCTWTSWNTGSKPTLPLGLNFSFCKDMKNGTIFPRRSFLTLNKLSWRMMKWWNVKSYFTTPICLIKFTQISLCVFRATVCHNHHSQVPRKGLHLTGDWYCPGFGVGVGIWAALIELLPKFVYIFPEKAIPDPGLVSITNRSELFVASRVWVCVGVVWWGRGKRRSCWW